MISDNELKELVGFDCPMSISAYRGMWSLMLGRDLTDEETHDAIRRINNNYYATHPEERGTTFNDIERSTEPMIKFWRSSL